VSNSIDNKIVSMKFDNALFERNAGQTLNTLAKLENSLSFSGASKGLEAVQANVGRFNLGPMEGAITGINHAWAAMATVAITTLATITSSVVHSAGQLAKAFSIGPVTNGYDDYNEKLTSVQTIMNATGASLKTVSGYFDQLDEYADKTIYNLKDMTGAFAKFTNAGVKMKDSIPAIKGISNMVALAGQGAGAASIAYYNLSQSIAGGFLTTVDYKSLNLANVATKEWKDQMIAGAVAAGTLKKTAKDTYTVVDGDSKKAFKSSQLFTEGLSEGWATTKVLLNVLGDYGDVTTEIGRKALAAAQDVKSLPMMLDTLKAAVGTGWTDTFEIILGTLPEAKKLFTDLTLTIGGFLDGMSDARNKVLGDWKELDGRTNLIEGIKNVFQALGAVIAPIKDAFREIFPAKTGQDLATMTKNFLQFTEGLKIGNETANNLKRTFAGVFAIFSIAGQIIGGLIGVVFDLFGTVNDSAGGFLNFTGGIGDFLVSVDQAMKKGSGLTNFFSGLTAVLKVPIQLIQALAGFVVDLFDGFDSSGADSMASSLGDLGDKMSPLSVLGDRVSSIFHGLLSFFERMSPAIQAASEFIQNAISAITGALQDAFSGGNFDTMLDAINTGLFAGLLLLFRQFINGGLAGILGKGRGGVIGSIRAAFGGLTNTLTVMQGNIKAGTLLKIAGAVGILTLSVVALSLIDSDKLAKALTAMAIGFGQLLGAMAILVKVSGSAGFVKVPLIAAAMVLLSTSVLILTGAIALMAQLSWEEIAKGLTGTAGALVIIAAAMRMMPLSLPITAAGLVLVGTGLAIIAGAMKLMGMLSWEEIGKGLTGVAGALVIIAGAMNLMPLTMPITAAGLVLVGAGLTAIAGAMKLMATMSWKELGKGLTGVAGALVIIAGAMNLMPLSMPITAAGLVLVGGALTVIAGALKIMGKQSWQEIGKGLTTLAGAMVILAVGLNAMTFALPGAAAMLVAAGALAILTPVLMALGSMSWQSIAKGLTAIAGAFAVVGLAGLLLSPIIVPITLLSGALLLVGAGLALAGAGALAFATAFAIVVTVGGAGAAVITAILGAIMKAIPAAMKAFGVGLIAFAGAIAQGGPAFTKAFVAVLDSLLNAVIKVTPKIGRAITVMIQTVLTVIKNNTPGIVAAGIFMIISLLGGIEKNIGKIVGVVGRIVVNFIDALGKQTGKMQAAGARFIIKFINDLAATIRAQSGPLGEAGANLATAIIEGMVRGMGAGIGLIANKAKEVAKSALDAAKKFLGVASPSKEFQKLGEYVDAGFAKGLVGGLDMVAKSLDTMKNTIKSSMEATMSDIEAQKARLEKLKDAKKVDTKEVAKAEKTLAQLQNLHARMKAARVQMTKSLVDEQKELKGLGKQYDDLTEQLKNANSELESAIKTRDDFAASTSAKFGNLPDIPESPLLSSYISAVLKKAEDEKKLKDSLDQLKEVGLDEATYQKLLGEGVSAQPLVDDLLKSGPEAIAEAMRIASTIGSPLDIYVGELGKQRSDIEKFHASLNLLKTMGLDDASYAKFLEDGVGIQPFLDELINAGPNAVGAINGLTLGVGHAADALGLAATAELKQAGVDAAQGLVTGLKSQIGEVEKQMRGIAKAMVKAIKKALKIKSPSREMDEVAKFTTDGLSGGLDKYSTNVSKSAATMANSALDTIKDTMSGLSDALSADMDMNPVVAPVLDLSQFRRDATQINSMLAAQQFAADVSYAQAASISSDREAAQTTTESATPEPVKVLEYTQNNYSPKALSDVEIYRQTKNQLSLAEEALTG
jgi:hypothetical protein